jgi:hypothetical protein
MRRKWPRLPRAEMANTRTTQSIWAGRGCASKALSLDPRLEKDREMKRLRPADLPAYLLSQHGISVARRTCDGWRTNGRGPKFRRWGRAIYLDVADVDDWVRARLSPPIRTTREALDHVTGVEA